MVRWIGGVDTCQWLHPKKSVYLPLNGNWKNPLESCSMESQHCATGAHGSLPTTNIESPIGLYPNHFCVKCDANTGSGQLVAQTANNG
jgi:hypothetical protein